MARLPMHIKCISFLYAAYGALQLAYFAFMLLLVSVSPSGSTMAAIVVSAEPLTYAVLYGVAFWSLQRQLHWSRWVFLSIAAINLAVMAWLAPLGIAAYEHYTNPPEGAYVVHTQKSFMSMVANLYAIPTAHFAVAALCAGIVLWHFRKALTLPSSGLPPA